MLNFDKENISQKAIQTIRSKYRDNQEFKPEKIMVASKAAESRLHGLLLLRELSLYWLSAVHVLW